MKLFARNRKPRVHDVVTYHGHTCEIVKTRKEGCTTFCVIMDTSCDDVYMRSVPAQLLTTVR